MQVKYRNEPSSQYGKNRPGWQKAKKDRVSEKRREKYAKKWGMK